jgi:hypothetical protein
VHPEEEHRNETNRGWAVRLAAILAVVGFAAGVLAITSGAPQTSAQAEAQAPDGLFTSLVKIDRKLAKLIHAVPDELPGPLIRRMTEISNDKREMIDQYFDNSTYGVKFSEVFRALDCLDFEIGIATGRIVEDKFHFSEGKVVDAIELGKKCKQRLERELHAASPAEPLSISKISANFVEADRATTYSVPTVTHPQGTTISYRWTLDVSSPAAKVDPSKGLDTNCNNHGVLSGTGPTFVWHHGNTGDPVHDDGCNHNLQGTYGHQGLITVKVSDSRGQSCTATYKGTMSSASAPADAASNPSCTGASP